jgi:hypothetical protein
MTAAVADGHHARVQASYPRDCRFEDFELELEVGLLLPALFELVQLSCGWVGVGFTRDDRIRFQVLILLFMLASSLPSGLVSL